MSDMVAEFVGAVQRELPGKTLVKSGDDRHLATPRGYY